MGTETRPSRALLFGAYGAIYGIWGSTYLAIRFTVQTLPPFLSGGSGSSWRGYSSTPWCAPGRRPPPFGAGSRPPRWASWCSC